MRVCVDPFCTGLALFSAAAPQSSLLRLRSGQPSPPGRPRAIAVAARLSRSSRLGARRAGVLGDDTVAVKGVIDGGRPARHITGAPGGGGARGATHPEVKVAPRELLQNRGGLYSAVYCIAWAVWLYSCTIHSPSAGPAAQKRLERARVTRLSPGRRPPEC